MIIFCSGLVLLPQAFAKQAEGEPPIAVVIRPQTTPQHKKIVKKKVELPPPPQVIIEEKVCPTCPTCPPAIGTKEEKRKLFSFSFALTLGKEKSFGKDSLGLDSWLVSPWSWGLMVGAEYNFTPYWSAFTDYYFAGSGFNDTQLGISLIQTDKTSSRWDVGAKYTFNKYVSLKGYIGLKQDYTLYITTLPFAKAEQFWHGLFGSAVGYHIWENDWVGTDGSTGLELYFPSTLSAFKARTGYALNTDVRFTFKCFPELFTFFRYEYFSVNPSNFTDQGGHYFLFGFGTTLSTRLIK